MVNSVVMVGVKFLMYTLNLFTHLIINTLATLILLKLGKNIVINFYFKPIHILR